MVTSKEIVNTIIYGNSFFEGELSLQTSLKDELGVDSLRMIEVIIELEEALDTQFLEVDLDPQALVTVQDLYSLVERYV